MNYYLNEQSGSFSITVSTAHPKEQSDEGSYNILQPFGLQDEGSEKHTGNIPPPRLNKICTFYNVLSKTYLIIVVFILSSVNTVYSQTIQKYSYYQIIEKQNIFKPLWTVVTDNEAERKRREEQMRLEEEKRKKEREQQLNELKKREEESALQRKKTEIESTLVLSGIVFNGQENLALIEDKRGQTGSSMYSVGDMIKEAKIESIDENKKEIVLDYQGKLKITLKLSK